MLLVAFAHGHKNISLNRQHHARRNLRLGKRNRQTAVGAHDFASGAHLWTQNHIHARKFGEWKNAFFHGKETRVGGFMHVQFIKRGAHHHARGKARIRNTFGLANKRSGAAGARIHFKHINHIVLHGHLHIHKSAHAKFFGQRHGLLANAAHDHW